MSWDPNDRPLIDDLKCRHRDDIETLRAQLDDDLRNAGSPTWADDVWLLRYALAFEGEIPAGVTAAKQAIEWRRSNSTQIEAAARRQPPDEFSQQDLVALKLFLAAAFYSVTVHGDPVFVSRLVGYNSRALMDQLGEQKLERWLDFTNECAWQYCEAASRASGIFVRQINLTDVASAPMKPDMPFIRALGASSKTNEWLRPQLVGKSYIFNPPMWLRWARSIAETVMSKKALERTAVHKGAVGVGKELCPFAKRVLGEHGPLPRFLGGVNSVLDAAEENTLFPSSQRPANALGIGLRNGEKGDAPVLSRLPETPAVASSTTLAVAMTQPKETSALSGRAPAESTDSPSSSLYPPTQVVDDAAADVEQTAEPSGFWSAAMCRRRRKESVPQVSEIEATEDQDSFVSACEIAPTDQAIASSVPIEPTGDQPNVGDTNRCCARWCCRRARQQGRSASQEQYSSNLLAT